MSAIAGRVVRLERAQPPLGRDGRDLRLIELCRHVYGDAYDVTMVPIGLTFELWWQQVTATSAKHTLEVNHEL